ncbi:MAG: hypothetical protein KAR19_03595 [Bacteroidales bacterium]|nr:hypothetical protein [Bacteroidales bacterium]
MARNDYTIPVKVRLAPGRYRHGYVKKLPANKNEKVSIMYAGGKISSRNGDTLIHEPRGFEIRST